VLRTDDAMLDQLHCKPLLVGKVLPRASRPRDAFCGVRWRSAL